ncbi:alpha/beta hydrolase [Roseicyclus mahoneyensis]|uniref:Acetyl esterase/lipase n=1 Tax=Roseicyclus mahoneyensis TaxID=164332 RepID=A0A316GGA5_9RHOB|nr:alpha/beta hydrolase [Roseicyclus mahoneyensis]PWK59664.1 acetyl esterase/lipase [Roseicyclus mahoneyensis]
MERSEEIMRMNGVRLAERVVPVPKSISHSAQLMLHGSVSKDGIPINASYEMPMPDDHDAWRRLRSATDAHYASMLKAHRSDVAARATAAQIGSATVHIATPSDLRNSEIVYIDLHGGAFVFGGGNACRENARSIADLHGIRCYGIDYRMPPDHPFPAALDDCLSVYRYAVQKYGADHVIIGGRSAGGNLALATALRAQDEGLTLPACLILLSPEIDLTESGDSFSANRTLDVNLPNPLISANQLYANGADLAHPYLSPLFGTFTATFPPTFIQSGTRDLFLSNAVRLHRKLCKAAVVTELHVFEAMPHGGFGGTEEDEEIAQEVGRFLRANVRGMPDSSVR